MTDREEEFAGKLRSYLDRAAGDLRPGIAYRLQAARAEALAHLTESPQQAGSGHLVGAHGLVGAGAVGGSFKTPDVRPRLSQSRLWTVVGLLALAIFGWQQWTAWQELDELEDLDAQILTSDLPVDALIDRGFHLFLQVAPTLMPSDAPASGEPADAADRDAPKADAPSTPASEPAAAQPAE